MMKLTRRDFALLAVIIYFTFLGGTFYSQLYFSLRIAHQVIVTAILGVWFVTKLRGKNALPRTSLDWAMAVFIAVNFLSAGMGQSPRFSLETLWFTLVHTLAFYLLVDLARRGWTPKLVWAFYMASAVVCLVAIAEFTAWYVGTPMFATFAQGWLEIGGWQQPIPPVIYRLAITLNGSTPLAAYLALLIPPALGLILTLPAKDENRKALIVWLGLALLVEILTFSRAGILALVCSLMLVAVGWQQVTGRGWADVARRWSQLSPIYKAALITGGLVVIGVGLFWLQNSFVNRNHSTSFRFTLWDAAVTIFMDQPVTGAGPANFGRALLRLNNAAYPRLQIATAHSIYFNTAAELGLAGLLAGAYLFLALGWHWLQRWRQASLQAEQIRLITCGAALAGLAVQTVVDTYTATPNMLVMLGLVAYLVADLRQESGPRYTVWLALGALLAYMVGFIWIARADTYLRSSFRLEAANHIGEAVVQAAKAQEVDPFLTLRTFRLALLEARLANQTGDPAWLRAAIEHYRAGLQQEPILGLHSANLAGLLWQVGARQEAISLLRQTVAVEREPLYLINLGHFYEQEGDWIQAGSAYGEALGLAPQLAGSGFWQASPGRAERWAGFVEAALASIPSDQAAARQTLRLKLALLRQDFKTVKIILSEASPADADEGLQAVLAQFYLDQGQPEQAADLLRAMSESSLSYLLQGRLKLETADDVTAERLFKTAAFLGNQEAHYYLGQLFERQGKLQAAAMAYQRGVSSRYISENIEVTIYGRLGGNDLAPQLLRIGLGEQQAQSPLALARLYEDKEQFEEARQIYRLLLAEDAFFTLAQERLELLENKLAP